MALPGDVTTFVLQFGDYTNILGATALAGLRATITPVDAQGREVRLTHVSTGRAIVPEPVEVTIASDGTGSIGLLPHTDNATLSPAEFLYKVEWNVSSRSPSPGNAIVAVPAASGTTIDYDLLVPVASAAPVSVVLPSVVSVAGYSGVVTTAQLTTVFGAAETVTQATQYRTLPDGATLLAQATPPAFGKITSPGTKPLIVYPDRAYQQIMGFGASLTDSAAYCALHNLTATQRHNLLDELFNPTRVGLSTVRVSFGASDFITGGSMSAYWTYDEMPTGQTDTTLTNFSLVGDNQRVIPVLKEILAINPRVKVIASVWIPPLWMKTTGQVLATGATNTSSTFNMTYAAAYGQYLVKSVQAWQDYGIPIHAVAPFNEPFHDTVSWTYLTDADYITLFKAVGDAFTGAFLDTKLILGDHHWSTYFRVQAVLADAGARGYADWIGWHGYSHMPQRQNTVHRAYPQPEHHFTEMRTLATEDWAASMKIMAGDVAIGSLRNWGQSVTLWNLFLDENGAPYTLNAGRRGVVTLPSNGSGAVRNAEFYVLAHLSQFIEPGARRIDSTSYATAIGLNPGTGHTDLESVAFVNPDRSIVLFAYNPTGASITTEVIDGRTQLGFPITLAAGEISTFTWDGSEQPATAPALSIAVPGKPTLSGTGGTAQTSLSWGAVTGATTYMIARDGADLLMLPGSRTSYTDTGVTAGSHSYTIRAQGVGGEGLASDAVTVTVTAPAPTNVLSANESTASTDVTLGRPVNGTLARSTTVFHDAAKPTSYALTSNVTTGGRIEAQNTHAVTVGQTVTVTAWLYNAVGTRTNRLSLWWYDAGNVLLAPTVDGAFTASPNATWVQRTISGVAPATAVGVKWVAQNGSGAVSDVMHVTEIVETIV